MVDWGLVEEWAIGGLREAEPGEPPHNQQSTINHTLTKHGLHGLDAGVDERVPAAADVVVLLRLDAQGRVDRREETPRVHLLRDHLVPLVVRLAVHRAALDAATAGDSGTPRAGEVVAAEAGVDLRR